MNTLAKKVGVKTLQILNWCFFLAMLVTNYLANALPFNGKTTGQLSGQYPNLFVPAGITFSIWGIIYLLLLFFCIKQSKYLLTKNTDSSTHALVDKVGFRFIVSCILNMLWIIYWHYENLFLSVIIMILLLITLIDIVGRISYLSKIHDVNVPMVVKASFGLYLGWICIATIANITAVLVFWGWNALGKTEEFWACLMVLIGGLISTWALNRLHNAFIGAAVLWAFLGIIIQRIGAAEYHRFIVWTTVFAIIVVGAGLILETTKAAFKKI
ncbi:hypothetical protein Emtol_0999 [Emticicia oligotrophica DSM 17448]|uniref:Tryptophan-rich sensory protein n=1 Tax=Emticicia oligotrophica (strain DSM 17448 / CIP 109782 / MTCC 6937 / GPTSA100-15) TaxID=929562 RepID=A0ABN4AJC1_EMTOG|nr:hypothetical protein [Emticicia oligotrophica]AFK02150.1 hypothetical protein Emtol_0999 [Emticicia oligotrophica DSM 17448]